MTEKRFEVVKRTELQYGIKKDNEAFIGLSFDRVTAEFLVSEWNSLDNENKKLKQENKELLDELLKVNMELLNTKSEKPIYNLVNGLKYIYDETVEKTTYDEKESTIRMTKKDWEYFKKQINWEFYK